MFMYALRANNGRIRFSPLGKIYSMTFEDFLKIVPTVTWANKDRLIVFSDGFLDQLFGTQL